MTSWQQVKKQIQTVLCDPGPLLCYVSIPGPWSEKVLLCAGESAGGSVRWLWMRQTLWTSVCQLHSHHNTGQNHCDDTQRYLESQNEAQSGRNRLSPSWLHLTLRKEWRGGAEASYWNKTTELKATKLADANKLPVLSTLATDTHACVNSQTELQNMSDQQLVPPLQVTPSEPRLCSVSPVNTHKHRLGSEMWMKNSLKSNNVMSGRVGLSLKEAPPLMMHHFQCENEQQKVKSWRNERVDQNQKTIRRKY